MATATKTTISKMVTFPCIYHCNDLVKVQLTKFSKSNNTVDFSHLDINRFKKKRTDINVRTFQIKKFLE